MQNLLQNPLAEPPNVAQNSGRGGRGEPGPAMSLLPDKNQNAPKEHKGVMQGKQSFKRVFGESAFHLCPLKVTVCS